MKTQQQKPKAKSFEEERIFGEVIGRSEHRNAKSIKEGQSGWKTPRKTI